MISVLMSIYEHEQPDLLDKCLRSLVEQEVGPDEVVIVWDGPIPQRLQAVVETYRATLNIVDVKLERNGGLGAALNAGLANCRHDLIARMDSDDTALPRRFALQLQAFRNHPDLDIISGYAVEVDAAGIAGQTRMVPADHDDIIKALWANPIIHPAVMFRRSSILSVGSYDPALRRRQDYELWFRCAAAGLKFANIPEPIISYRFTSETHKRQSRKGAWQQGMIGFNGSRSIGLPLWKQVACFAPFVRSLLPTAMQHQVYRFMQKVDPRRAR